MKLVNIVEELNKVREAIRELYRVEDLTNKNYNARWGLYVLGKLAIRKLETQLHELPPQPNK